jgi:hypothetical protein
MLVRWMGGEIGTGRLRYFRRNGGLPGALTLRPKSASEAINRSTSHFRAGTALRGVAAERRKLVSERSTHFGGANELSRRATVPALSAAVAMTVKGNDNDSKFQMGRTRQHGCGSRRHGLWQR